MQHHAWSLALHVGRWTPRPSLDVAYSRSRAELKHPALGRLSSHGCLSPTPCRPSHAAQRSVTFAAETHPSSDSSFLCRGLKRVGTYRAIPQLPLCPPGILTPTLQSLSPMARKMVLPQEEPRGQQCLR